jgi:transposase
VAKVICGVDVDSRSLKARIGFQGRSQTFPNTVEGIAELAAFCQKHQVELVAMEATGGYEKLAYVQLWAAGVPVAICNARAVREFARAMGLLEKTDEIDAGAIAWYAETKRVAARCPLSPEHEHLKALVTRLRQVTELRTSQRQQRILVTDAAVLASINEILNLLTAQIRKLQAEIAEQIASDPLWQKLDQSFRTIKGVADRTVARLMAELPEIGTLSNKAVSKLAGLAPLADDSGKHHGKRRVRGGRSNVRHLLFIVATVVRRYHPDFAAFHQRLSAAGKPKKVILIALAHKLLVRLNAKARETRQQLAGESNILLPVVLPAS